MLEDNKQKREIKPIINTELIRESCSKSLNRYNNCNYSNYTNKALTKNVGYLAPCFFVIYKIDIDFSQAARDQIKSSIEKNDSNLNFKALLQELENEPQFNKKSLEDLKKQIEVKHNIKF